MDKELLKLIADTLERIAPPARPAINLSNADAFVWDGSLLHAVDAVSHVPLELLRGIDHVRDILLRNSRQFAEGKSANNALLWGSRGTGKSSLVKAIHAHINQQSAGALVLVEIHREDLATLSELLAILRASTRRFILFCDDLSFDAQDASYKSLKTVLDGGIEGRPENVLFYATSNRRHLMPREMVENEQATAIHPGESVEEKVSLSDRFGLWLGFHNCNQETYLSIVEGYVQDFKLTVTREQWQPLALEWAQTRGARSGRVAWQFVQDLKGQYS